MATYRCFFFDDAKRIIGAEVVELRDDGAAVMWATEMLERGFGLDYAATVAVEVWHLDRLVCRQAKPNP
jgi:hypothetical protein